MVTYFSKQGLVKLKEELEYRKSVLKSEIAKKIQEAKTLGDLSENMEYQEAMNMQSFNEGKIRELEQTIRSAILIEEENHKYLEVEVGATVKVSSRFGEQTFTIVGSLEANPANGFISNESPLGQAFLGHIVGEEVEVSIPNGKEKYKILDIK